MRLTVGFPALTAVLALFLGSARAQGDPPRTEFRGTLGWSTFADEGFLHHFTVGAAARYYLLRRLGAEAELTYMYRDRTDRDIVFIPNLVWEFTGRQGRVQPYLIGGFGVLHHRGTLGPYTFSGNAPTWGIGVGVKIFVSRRVFVTPEYRMGWEPFARFGMSVGFAPRQ